MVVSRRRHDELPARTILIEPFDLMMHATEAGVTALQGRFSAFLRTLDGPARFLCWQMPADLNRKISAVSQTAREVEDRARAEMCMAYRRHYEQLQVEAEFQRALCGMILWTEETGRTVANGLSSAFDTPAIEADLPPLFEGRYGLREVPFSHLSPIGRPGGRPFWAILNSYEFLPAAWNFFRPIPPLLRMNFPLALCIDIPETLDRNKAVDAVEGIIQAYQVHLVSLRGGEDSRAITRINDCRRTLAEINQGDALHTVRISIAVAANTLDTLKARVSEVMTEARSYFRLRHEVGELLSRSTYLFSPSKSSTIGIPNTTHPVTSRELALMLAPLGYRKLGDVDGVLRGEAVGGKYPVFHNSWRDRRAVHEVWVGQTGFGKTFALNCLLNREYAENGVSFDMLEPMGHGKHLAAAFGLPWYVLSAQTTCLNPQDVMFPTLLEQTSHTIRIYETVMGRALSGGQRENLERGLLAQALEIVYAAYADDLERLAPDKTPISDFVCDVLSGLGEKDHIKQIAKDLADEIAALVTGSGPWAKFLNGTTTFDFGRSGRNWIEPRIFSFHQLENDANMIALAYAQCLAAIRRDSLRDEQPRIIAVDEVYRMLRHPSLLDFLIEAAKTFRTRRKKLISIDQNMSIFLEGKARLIFENSPIRVIFAQKQGMNVFREDAAFQHFNEQHLSIISSLPRFHFLLDIQDEGTFYLFNRASRDELRRFSST
ncbi:MAG: hypothetical protein BroJett018_22040 [Chloroflexota bacterium]|nr:hypothetical protein [Chloroflexota bacterium]NOG66103.1 hypothetical protein [Chloroflexota bacterium]GIK64410.1 MAG: hypothetical protein BroJett018_22040 [Chloroflexota bacterium]